MKYPMINNWLIFERRDRYTYTVYDGIEEELFLMGDRIADFAKKLDGKTNPYAVDPELSCDEVNEFLDSLKENDFLRYNKVMISRGTVYRTIWIPGRSGRLRFVAAICNGILKILWVPFIIIGVLLFCKYMPLDSTFGFIPGCALGLILGITCHELGHAFAGLAYGAHVFEVGVMVQNFMPGAYVLLCGKGVKSRMKRVQIYAAGIEANFMLAGICLILGCVFPVLGVVAFYAAAINVTLALINIIFVKGFDGMAIISEFLGVEDLADKAKDVLFDRKRRQQLCAGGVNGYAVIVASGIVWLLQIALPLIIGMGILEVITWIL